MVLRLFCWVVAVVDVAVVVVVMAIIGRAITPNMAI